ncbi:MAG: hypothetical protein DWQ20_00980 [Actinobacteria bacterium]|nr:MAG: hypothetical protein DWQ20_00980 [Actinomycetota bacterium]
MMNGQGQNGQANGHLKRGEKGGAAPTGIGVRSTLNATRKLAETGQLATDAIPGAIEVAVRIINGNGTDRDRMAAMKVLAALAKYSSEAELELDKLGRLDRGESTENNRLIVDYGERGRHWTR